MKYQHQQLAAGRWQTLSFCEQMANIGSEIGRTIKWANKNKQELSERAFVRGLELLDLTISDKRNVLRLKELLRLREVLADYFVFDNEYKSTDLSWQKYFLPFNFAARI